MEIEGLLRRLQAAAEAKDLPELQNIMAELVQQLPMNRTLDIALRYHLRNERPEDFDLDSFGFGFQEALICVGIFPEWAGAVSKRLLDEANRESGELESFYRPLVELLPIRQTV